MSVNRAANRVHVEGAQRRRRNRNFSQQKLLLFEKNHKIPFPKKFPIFKTDECRTLAESVASLDFIGDFIAFFSKPLTVTLPISVRFKKWETAGRARMRFKKIGRKRKA